MKNYIFYLFMLMPSLFMVPANAQSTLKQPARKTLYSTIVAMDKQVFDAYNKCDLDKFEDYFDRDVEIFNDRTGYAESRGQLMKTMRSMCENGGQQRVLVSAQVFPLDFYGAVETGVNKYFKVVNGKSKLISTAKFIHIWKQKDSEWKITKVVSYDHVLN